MKKIALAMAGIGLASSLGAYAALPTTALPFQLEIPNLKSGLEIVLEGLYLRPTNSMQDWGTLTTTTSTDSSVSSQTAILTNDPSYGFGFRVGLGYVFADSGNDVQLAWTRLEHGHTANYHTKPGETLLGGSTFDETNQTGTYIVGDTTVNINEDLNGGSTINNELNSIDLDVGQYLNIGTRLQIRLHGGLRAAQVEQTVDNIYHAMRPYVITDNTTGATLSKLHWKDDLELDYDSTFQGIGPRFGIDSSYHLWNCFGLVGHFSGNLLVGEVKANASSWQRYNVIDDTTGQPMFPGLPIIIQNYVSSDDTWRVVPGFDAKLGLNYTWLIKKKVAVNFEAGYQITEYFDAVDTLDPTPGLSDPNRSSSNLGFDGPYASIGIAL